MWHQLSSFAFYHISWSLWRPLYRSLSSKSPPTGGQNCPTWHPIYIRKGLFRVVKWEGFFLEHTGSCGRAVGEVHTGQYYHYICLMVFDHLARILTSPKSMSL